MGVRKAVADYPGVFVGGGCFGAQQGGAQLEQELFGAAHVLHVHFGGAELFAGDAHPQEGLLHKGFLPALGGLVYDHVLALFQQVSYRSLFAVPANIVFPRYRLVVDKCGIHSVTTMFQTQK